MVVVDYTAAEVRLLFGMEIDRKYTEKKNKKKTLKISNVENLANLFV